MLCMPVQYATLYVLCGSELAGNWRDAKLFECMWERKTQTGSYWLHSDTSPNVIIASTWDA